MRKGPRGGGSPAGRGRRRSLLLTTAFLAAAALFLLWQQKSIVPEEIAVYSPRLPAAFDGFRVSVVSDVHGRLFGKDNRRLCAAVAAQRPDLIAITGDLIERVAQLNMVPALAEGLSAIAPTYYITGNHEWSIRVVPELIALLEEHGVTALENEYQMLERGGDVIALAGVHDPNGRADQIKLEDLAERLRGEEGDVFTLLLSHRNTRFAEYAAAQIDVTLSGHGHGGLIRLPGIDGLISTERTLFPQWTAGLYQMDGAQMVVSRGIGNVFFTLRLFNRPHLPVVILKQA